MSTVHRLLDEAFAGQPSTPEVQDLKEEIRAGLVERAAELEAAGVSADEAARRAVDELGDVTALVAEVAGTGGDAGGNGSGGGSAGRDGRQPGGIDAAALAALHRVRPKPGFVVAAVVASTLGVIALVGLAATTYRVDAWSVDGVVVPLALAATVALVGAWLVRESLLQETTTHHPLPSRRATGWGGGSGLVLLGLGVAACAWTDDGSVTTSLVVAGAAIVVAGVAWLSWLGATQTNRTKAWVLETGRAAAGADRFSRDPAAAARFGVYTLVIWVLAAVGAAVVGLTAGWWWALLPLVAGLAAMMLTLARMLFGAEPTDGGTRS